MESAGYGEQPGAERPGHRALRDAPAKDPGSTPAVKAPPGVAYKGGDGRDRNHAVIIKGAGSEAVEAEAELKWLESQQQSTGDFSVGPKGTTFGPMFDVITITTGDGQEKTVYFGFKPPKMMFKPATSTP